jgi:endonuclease YncB( thermonuclease family)
MMTRLHRYVCILVLTTGLARGDDFQAKVVGVADGDTIRVLRDRELIKIRLHGIDCPEKGQALGNRARQFTSGLAFGKNVGIQVKDRDRYGRTVAVVVLPDGRSLNAELVRAGLAWHYRRYSRNRELQRLEDEAREAKRGLWADPQPVPPWECRKAPRSAKPPTNRVPPQAIRMPPKGLKGINVVVFIAVLHRCVQDDGGSRLHRVQQIRGILHGSRYASRLQQSACCSRLVVGRQPGL